MRPIIKDLNGAKLFYIQTDRFKSEYFSLRFTVPLCTEHAQKNALLMAVLGRGTRSYPTKLALNRRLDTLYSTSVSSRNHRLGDMQSIGFSADFLGARYVNESGGILSEVLDVLSELWYHPLLQDGIFCEEYVKSEKNNLCDAIRAAINNPRGYAMAKCRKLLCPGEPFALSLIGEEESVATMTGDNLFERHQALVKGAVPTFVYVGNTPIEELIAMLQAHFDLSVKTDTPFSAIVKRGEGAPIMGQEEMPLAQGKLALGFRTDAVLGHPLAPAMLVLNEIYGGSPASKLFLNVREQRSLCYHCSSAVDLYKGVLFANAGMKSENRTVTEEAMLEEFRAIEQGRITVTEFEAAKCALDHSYRQVFDNPVALADFYAGRALIGNTDTVDDFRRSVAQVTVDDVVAAAQHIHHGATFFLNGTLEGEEVEE